MLSVKVVKGMNCTLGKRGGSLEACWQRWRWAAGGSFSSAET